MERIDTDYKRRLSKTRKPTQTCNLVTRLLTFTQVIDVGHVTVSSPLVIGQRGGLSVGLVTNVTCVRFVVGMHNMMLV